MVSLHTWLIKWICGKGETIPLLLNSPESWANDKTRRYIINNSKRKSLAPKSLFTFSSLQTEEMIFALNSVFCVVCPKLVTHWIGTEICLSFIVGRFQWLTATVFSGVHGRLRLTILFDSLTLGWVTDHVIDVHSRFVSSVLRPPLAADSSRGYRSLFGWRGTRSGSLGPLEASPRSTSMAASLGILREAGHPSLNETLKQHNGVTFKLVKTGEYI